MVTRNKRLDILQDGVFVACYPTSNDISGEFEFTYNPIRGAWCPEKWGAIPTKGEYIQILATDFPMPVIQKQSFKIAQVLSYEPALQLLGDIYDKVSLPVTSMVQKRDGNLLISLSMLAAAGLCDVSPVAVRLSDEGKKLVEFITQSEAEVKP